MLLIWLFGLNNLVGLNRSLTIMILVPVSILVLGVDYAIHSLHRYEEERAKAGEPGKSLGISMAGVGGALFLAMVTTVVAFGSNVISEIEEIIGFGISAALAILSAFWIMGFFVPAAKMLWDRRKFKKQTLRPGKEKEGVGSKLLSRIVVGLADKRYFVLPVVLVLSLGAGYLAVQLEARLDVKEYFDNSSDFVVSLDKLDEHVAEKGGEPAVIYIEGDLSDPEVLDTMKELEASFSDNENIARDPYTGEVLIYADPFYFLEKVLENNYTIGAIQAAYPGVNITDNDNDSLPDGSEQLEVVLEYIYESGIPLNRTTMMYEIDQVREVLWRDNDDQGSYATIIMTGVPDTRELATVQASEKEYRKDMELLEGVEGITYYGLTGSGYERDATLTAITDSLSFSIIVAVVLCFIVLVVLFRSFKYAVVTVIPEILVAAWLYALMFLAGYHLNAVTATIAAISIGVGIDYSVHVTARFRQELKRYEGKRREALDHAAKHSGVALLGSAASTMFGFAIIGFAPMPMFSSYGILTALMILMAFVAALLVLPSLLFLVTREKKDTDESEEGEETGT
jgi:predicted RND superfamily exporter protein